MTANYHNATGTQYPAVFSDQAGTTQVSCAIKLNGHIVIQKRNLTTGTSTFYDLEGDTVANTNGITPVTPVEDVNAVHYGIAIGYDDQGRVHLTGNSLSTTPHYIRSAAGSISSWTSLSWPWPGFNGSTGNGTTTYNYFNAMSDGRLLWWVSEREPGGAPSGIHYLGHILPLGASNWSPLVGTGIFANSTTTPQRRIYLAGVWVEYGGAHPDRVWVAGVGRDQWDDTTTQRHNWLIYNDTVTNSATWKAIDGTTVPMPVLIQDVEGSAWNVPLPPGATWSGTASGQIVVWQGKPHLIIKRDATTEFHHTWWTGSAWTTEICNTGSLAPSLFLTRQGPMMFREFGGRIVVSSILAGGPSFQLGLVVDGEFNMPAYDPIRQQRDSVLALQIPDNDTARLWDFGARLRYHP